MSFMSDFISQYGTTILYTILMAIAGYLGLVLKSSATKYLNDRTKREVAKTCVNAVEQLYKNLHGEEKLAKAMQAASEMLAEKGIPITELELKMLIESTLAECNDAFKCGR